MAEGRRKRRGRRIVSVLFGAFVFVLFTLSFLQFGCLFAERTWLHWYPDYEKQDISALLVKETLDESEYELLYRQTGLTKVGVDRMRGSAAGRRKIGVIQEKFFTKYKISNDKFNPFTYMEEIDGYTTLCDLEDGDILVTATTRVSWLRYGHAALVVDGKSGTLAEVLSPGTVSEYSSASSFCDLADFLVLRPKVSAEKKQEIVEYVKTEMLGVPYAFTAGILTPKFEERLSSTQCAHFVWYAYKKFGVDLDSTGGMVVKPQDIANSPHVEVVQSFGFDLDALWS